MRSRRPPASGDGPDRPTIPGSTSRRLLATFVAILVVATAADLFVHHHEHFGIEDTFGFHAWYGLLAGGAAVVASAGLGWMLRRRDPGGEGGGPGEGRGPGASRPGGPTAPGGGRRP